MDQNTSRAFCIVTDRGFLPGARALVNSIWAYHRDHVAIAIYQRGLAQDELSWFWEHPARPIIHDLDQMAGAHRGMWECKQQALAWELKRHRLVYLLDADTVLCSAVDDVFDFAAAGFIVSSLDGEGVQYDDRFSSYGITAGTRSIYINSGAICLDLVEHWRVVALWSFAANHAAYSGAPPPLQLHGHGDQGVLNAIISGMDICDSVYRLSASEWCDSGLKSIPRIIGTRELGALKVINSVTGLQQRIIHSTGPKWWTARGAVHNARFGDKLRIFEHFANMEYHRATQIASA